MKTELFVQFGILLIMLLITTSEGFFFEYPKKLLTDLIHTLKGKKQAKEKPYDNGIHHYHVHYYPVSYSLHEPPVKAPKQYELEDIYNEHLATLGWSDREYKHVPEPKIKFPPNLYNAWKDPVLREHDTLGIEDYYVEDKIFTQVPFSQKIIIEYANSDKKLMKSLL